MAEIYEFPIKSLGQWAHFENIIRNQMDKDSVPKERQDEVIGQVKVYFDLANVIFNIYPPKELLSAFPEEYGDMVTKYAQRVQELTEGLTHQIHNCMSAILDERMKLERKIYDLKHKRRIIP